MTREEFIAKYEVLEKHFSKGLAISNALCIDLLDGYPAVKYGTELERHYIELLANASGISEDWISYLLYEGGGECYYGDVIGDKCEVEMVVKTAEDLWDFLQLCDELDNSKKDTQVLLCD